MTDHNITRLLKIDCCALSDALDRLGLKGAVTGIPRRAGEKRIAGRAVTMKLGLGDTPKGPVRHLGVTAIESSDHESIIVVEQHTAIEAGSWGGLLTLGAKMRDVQGVIVDGPLRDVDEAIEHKFDLFATSLTAFTARGRIVEKGTNIQIVVGGILVEPDDYVVADSSAVVFIRPENIEKILEVAEEIIAKEAAMAKAILAGTPMSEVMGGNYEFMLKGK